MIACVIERPAALRDREHRRQLTQTDITWDAGDRQIE